MDTNVLLDVVTQDARWSEWSSSKLAEAAESSTLIVNPIIYAEISIAFERIEDVDVLLSREFFRREEVPYEAAFLAGKAFMNYRKRGGRKTSTLPDFFIGAHAAVRGYRLLTRDAARYRTYFPTVEVVAPR